MGLVLLFVGIGEELVDVAAVGIGEDEAEVGDGEGEREEVVGGTGVVALGSVPKATERKMSVWAPSAHP